MTRRPQTQVPRASPADRRLERRRELLAAAIDVIRRQGAAVTMEEMATAGGISKPILYRHFGDRDGLVSAITEKALVEIGAILERKLGEALNAEPPNSIRATIDAFFEYIESDPQLYRFIVDSDSRRGNEATTAFTDRIAEHVAGTLAAGLVDSGYDPGPSAIWGRAIVGMVQNTANWWIGGAESDRAATVDALTDLVWRGIAGSVAVAGADEALPTPR